MVVRLIQFTPQVSPDNARGIGIAFTLPAPGRLLWRVRRLFPYPGDFPALPLLPVGVMRLVLSVCCYDTVQHAEENMRRIELFRANKLPGYQVLSAGSATSYWACIAVFTSWS